MRIKPESKFFVVHSFPRSQIVFYRTCSGCTRKVQGSPTTIKILKIFPFCGSTNKMKVEFIWKRIILFRFDPSDCFTFSTKKEQMQLYRSKNIEIFYKIWFLFLCSWELKVDGSSCFGMFELAANPMLNYVLYNCPRVHLAVPAEVAQASLGSSYIDACQSLLLDDVCGPKSLGGKHIRTLLGFCLLK